MISMAQVIKVIVITKRNNKTWYYKQYCVTDTTVLSIFTVYNLNLTTRLIRVLNGKLNILCKGKSFHYFLNENITQNHLAEDGI